MKKTAYLYDTLYMSHDTGWGHPECPERLMHIHTKVQSSEYYKLRLIWWLLTKVISSIRSNIKFERFFIIFERVGLFLNAKGYNSIWTRINSRQTIIIEIFTDTGNSEKALKSKKNLPSYNFYIERARFIKKI